MFEVADRLKNVKVSASAAMTRKVRDLRAQGVKIVGLSSGEPDFPTPTHAIEAAHAAALAGETKYPPQDGTPALKAAIQRKFKRDNNLDYALDEILVTNGGKQSIFNAFMATIDPGDDFFAYANKTWLSQKMDASALSGYKIWLAQYAAAPTYTGRYDLWQYKSTGKVSGISGNVDLNLSYLGY